MTRKIRFDSEYQLHRLTQKHLKELFDLECIASEIQLNRLRLDNLAFDEKTGSFVIIEYKNEVDLNVFTQAQDYLDLLLENKEFFLNRLDDDIEVDFENTRIMIIGPEFGENQISDAKDIFELWKITLFDDGKVCYKNLKTDEIKSIYIDPDELKLTEESLLEDKSDEMRKLYFNLKDKVLAEYGDVDFKTLVNQFSFRVTDKLICVAVFQKSSFSIFFYGKNLENAEKTVDISDKSTGGNADYNLKYKSDDDLDYFMDLFSQTYNQKR